MIHILAIENHKDELAQQWCERYIQRMHGPYKLSLELLPSSKVKDAEQQKIKESETILKSLKPGDVVFLCDEKGKIMDSIKFANLLKNELSTARGRIVFCIGGAYGFTTSLIEQFASIRLSEFTFPHLIARLVLTEQIYRAYEISKGTGYHHI